MQFIYFVSFLALVFGVMGLDPVSTDLGPVLGHYNGAGVIEYTGLRIWLFSFSFHFLSSGFARFFRGT